MFIHKLSFPLFLLVAITALLALNTLLLLHLARLEYACNCDCDFSPVHRSHYAGLDKTILIPIQQSTEYTTSNTTLVTELWESLSGDPGVVALPRPYVSEKRLPYAMRFPWDTTKDVYLLQGFHSLHCLVSKTGARQRTLFRYAHAADQALPQRIAFRHVLHYLDQLRQDVLCHADDTPRYAGFQTGNPPGTGAGHRTAQITSTSLNLGPQHWKLLLPNNLHPLGSRLTAGRPLRKANHALHQMGIPMRFLRDPGAVRRPRRLRLAAAGHPSAYSLALAVAVVHHLYPGCCGLRHRDHKRFTQCRPLRKYWDPSVPGSCWPPEVQQSTGYFQSCKIRAIVYVYHMECTEWLTREIAKAVCCAVDLTLAVFPASLFWSLNMEWKKKVSLSCLKGLGLFAMIASIVKTVQLRAIAATDDLTHAMAHLAFWWTLEANLVILAASIPTLRPIVHPRARSQPATSPGSQNIPLWWGRLTSPLWRGPKGVAEESAIDSFQLLSLSSRESRRGSQPLEQGEDSGLKKGAIKKTTTIGIVYEGPGDAEAGAGAEGEGLSPWPPQPQLGGAGSRRPSGQ
ncbi:hypothetical protein BJY04DRAFT_212434 [Aspergillus karnatakaensis]|uniref:uncharacterized protein n=1 Tax=Aspergillus karnatakaensis TaxID=1810916 RepID=UPI003CCCEFAE